MTKNLLKQNSSFIVSIASSVFIVVLSIIVQLADGKIDDHYKEILSLQTKTNQLHILADSRARQRNFATLLLALDTNVMFDASKRLYPFDDPHVDSQSKRLLKSFSSGKISSKEYLKTKKDMRQKQYIEFWTLYNHEIDNLNKLVGNPLRFWECTKTLSYIFQFILLGFVVYLQAYLHKSRIVDNT